MRPDIMVRAWTERPIDWNEAPVPFLVVEILSDVTRRRDRETKRELYLDAGVPTYWIVDGDARTIHTIQLGAEDTVASDVLTWHPHGAAEALVLDVRAMFREALGG